MLYEVITVLEAAVRIGDCGLERVQIDGDQVDRVDVGVPDRRHVGRQVAARQDAAVDLRVQGLDAPPQNLRAPRVRGYLLRLHAVLRITSYNVCYTKLLRD